MLVFHHNTGPHLANALETDENCETLPSEIHLIKGSIFILCVKYIYTDKLLINIFILKRNTMSLVDYNERATAKWQSTNVKVHVTAKFNRR